MTKFVQIKQLRLQKIEFELRTVSSDGLRYRKAKIQCKHFEFLSQKNNLYLGDKLNCKKIKNKLNSKSKKNHNGLYKYFKIAPNAKYKWMYRHVYRLIDNKNNFLDVIAFDKVCEKLLGKTAEEWKFMKKKQKLMHFEKIQQKQIEWHITAKISKYKNKKTLSYIVDNVIELENDDIASLTKKKKCD